MSLSSSMSRNGSLMTVKDLSWAQINLLAAVGQDRGFQFSISWLRWATMVALQRVCKKRDFSHTQPNQQTLPSGFEKRRVSLSVFTFNMASLRVNTEAEGSDFDMSTSEEEIDSESESYKFLSLSCFFLVTMCLYSFIQLRTEFSFTKARSSSQLSWFVLFFGLFLDQVQT